MSKTKTTEKNLPAVINTGLDQDEPIAVAAPLPVVGLELANPETLLERLEAGDAADVSMPLSLPPTWTFFPGVGLTACDGPDLACQIRAARFLSIEEDNGTINAPLCLLVETAAGPRTVWCSAVLERVVAQLAGARDGFGDRRSRDADECNEAFAASLERVERHVIGIHYMGRGTPKKGQAAPRLFHVDGFGRSERVLPVAWLERFTAALAKSKPKTAPTAPAAVDSKL